MNYATGCAFNTKEIFENLDRKKLKLNSKLAESITGDRHLNSLIFRIFKDSMKLIFKDIIDNNVTFLLPTTRSNIHIHRVTGDDLVYGRQHGQWQDVDFLKSNFSGYQLMLDINKRNGMHPIEKPIYLNKEYKDQITKNTNEGKQYC